MERGADARRGAAPAAPGDRPDAATTPLGLRHLALREQVLDELRRRIVDGVYPPGSRLTEDRLAEDFGVSRNPVREALRVAVADGLVTLSPRRGATVAVPDPSSVADLFAVRGSLEPLAARLAAERVTPADVAALRALLDEAARATDAGDLARVAQLNTDLHLAVVRLSGNRWLTSVVTPLYLHVQWVFRLGAEVRAPHSWREHIRLVDAIAAGDPDGAAEAARAHVEAAARAATDA
ncbi:GntR family transcriptional regulator [Lapillicoccus jejuensis]|uniref:DNA-binding GntR family transcriptional regulator n=1 Tax=Lapillicoccus jejuensis TaxID=402171 RepID=A0A542DYH6_9MICO|nr:GntR family transcriptional regulator [Lapillicoccus jejuensis]TQJ08150.1 DNA-binding GntR family transcriptional regulator [Lapillicoccus jejuensis]